MKILSLMLVALGVGMSFTREDVTVETRLHRDMQAEFPKFRRLGAVCSCGESSPFVFNGALMRMELFDPSWGTNSEDARICTRIRDLKSGKILSELARGCYYSSAMVDGEVVRVTATKRTYWLRGERKRSLFCGETVVIFESTDLIHWTERELFTRPDWKIFNTTLTKGPEGYMLAYECSRSDCRDFTMFFAKSTDLRQWEFLPENRAYPADRYSGGPLLRYYNGYYYLFLVTELPCQRYCTYLFRTQDFQHWDVGRYNPFMFVTDDDRRISPNALDLLPEVKARVATAFVCSLSDVDLCEFEGKTYLNYGIGDQHGFYYLAEAWYDGPLGQLLEDSFK